MLFHDYFYTCNAPPPKKKVDAQIYTKGERSGQGYFPLSRGRVWGGGSPLPRKFLRFLPENGAFWLHFLPQARFSVLFIFAAQEFFPENKWLKFHDFSMTLSIFHDFP